MITSSGAKTDDSGTSRLTKEDFERLERSAVKVARSVLRGRRRSNALLLPDVRQGADEIIALPTEHRGDKARCAVNGSLLTQARWVTVWSEAVRTMRGVLQTPMRLSR